MNRLERILIGANGIAIVGWTLWAIITLVQGI
jgi:hypothetical protein